MGAKNSWALKRNPWDWEQGLRIEEGEEGAEGTFET